MKTIKTLITILAVLFLLGSAILSGILILSNWHSLSEIEKRDIQKDKQRIRSIDIVGIKEELKTQVKLSIKDGKCLKVSNALLDGLNVSYLLINTCRYSLSFGESNWVSLSPEGTALYSDMKYIQYFRKMPYKGSSAESFNIKEDNRISKVVITIDDGRQE